MHMNRREAVIRMAVFMGATALGPRLLAGKNRYGVRITAVQNGF
jgi:hypothetical protein